MPILNPIILPTVGLPQPAVAPLRQRRTMVNPEFYQQGQGPSQQDILKMLPMQQQQPIVTRTDTPTPQFANKPSTGDAVREQIERVKGRAAPPELSPGARVVAPNMNIVAPSNFQKFYESLNLVEDIGNQQLATEQAKSAMRRQAALQSVFGQAPPAPTGGGGTASQVKYSGGGNVMGWIQQAAGILAQSGINLSPQDMQHIGVMIQHESGGNPNAINNWDSNAAKGTPSKGLMQTIDPTFNSNKLPGYNDIYNPVHNIIAGVRYAVRRYGSISNVPGIRNLNSGRGYVGY